MPLSFSFFWAKSHGVLPFSSFTFASAPAARRAWMFAGLAAECRGVRGCGQTGFRFSVTWLNFFAVLVPFDLVYFH